MRLLGSSLERQNETYTICGIPVIKLAENFGTPLYVYDADLFLQRYQELARFLKWPQTRIMYAVKANYNVGLLKILNQAGGSVECVSPAELYLALQCGFSADRLLYTANNITDEEMHEAYATGVLFNIGSLSRLEKYGRAFPGTKISLRFNPDVVAGEHVKIQTGGDLTKFGILLQDVPLVKELAGRYKLTVVGLHEHTGSGIADTEKVLASIKNILKIARRENFPDLEFLDFGGGFKVPYYPDEKRIDYEKLGSAIGEAFSNFCRRYGSDLQLRFEPGKYVAAECGYLLVQVNTLKNNRGRLIAGTDSGFPQLIRPVMYDAYHHIVNLSRPSGEEKTYDVVGNICETGDRLALDRKLPEIHEGDYLAVLNAGAYCYAMGGIYNLRPMPGEVIIYQGQVQQASKKISNRELAMQLIKDNVWRD